MDTLHPSHPQLSLALVFPSPLTLHLLISAHFRGSCLGLLGLSFLGRTRLPLAPDLHKTQPCKDQILLGGCGSGWGGRDKGRLVLGSFIERGDISTSQIRLPVPPQAHMGPPHRALSEHPQALISVPSFTWLFYGHFILPQYSALMFTTTTLMSAGLPSTF